MSDDLLERAARELRGAHDGESGAADETLGRVLETLDAKKRAPEARVLAWTGSPKSKRTALRAAAALAATLALTTAWAASTGRLGRLFEPEEPMAPAAEGAHERGTETATTPRAPAVTARAADPRPSSEDEARPNTPTTEDSTAPAKASDAPPSAPPKANARAATTSEPVAIASPARAPSTVDGAVDPNDVAFERAHRLHFDGDHAAALAAWDIYLQNAPNGRFAPEARFNRAIALWKLGRRDEARQALEPFARGVYGDYRRDEAKRLLDAAER